MKVEIKAAYFTIAMEKARQGYAADLVLDQLMFNSGFEEFCKPTLSHGTGGHPVSRDTVFLHNPILMEDMEGGILPGDEVKATESGWKWKGKVVVRAQVKRCVDTPDSTLNKE